MRKKSIAFITGWGFHSSIFQKISANFPDENCLQIDLPTPSDDVISDLNSSLPDEIFLVGWSLGGTLAIKLAEKYPYKYQGLMTISTNPRFISEGNWPGIDAKIFENFRQLAEKNPSELLKNFSRLVMGNLRDKQIREEIFMHLKKNPEEFYLEFLEKTDAREALQRLNLPSLHVFGDEDFLVPTACAQAISPQKVKIIEGAGHVSFLTHEQKFMKILREFIS